LLDDRNIRFAHEARARDMRPYLHTNGDVLLRRPDLCRNVVEMYTRVVVGLYDYTTDTERVDQEVAWRERLAGTRVEFSAIGLEGRRSGKSMAIPKARVPTDARMSIPDLTYPNAPCARPLVRMIIQHDGDVCNCCEDTTGAFSLGNVFRQSLGDIWFGEPHARVVKDLAAGHREKYALCRSCPLGPSAQRPDGERISMAPRRHAETSR
jgi:radical SAM protein with 4Fe4S-binding SPASM domain